MSDAFRIIPPQVRAEGKDVPPEQIQAGFNSLANQVTTALNNVAADPTGPAGGDLSGSYPNPTVSKVNGIAAGTMANQNANAVAITGGTVDGTVIGGTTRAAGHFTTADTTTPIAVTSGGSGQNALNAHNVIIGEGSSPVGFAAPSATAGVPLVSTGSTTDPSFGTATVPGGGTGLTTIPAHGVMLGEGTSNVVTATPTATTGIPLVSQGSSADPSFSTASVAGGGTGLTTIPAHAVMLGEGTGNVGTAAPTVATGVPLVSNGTSADPSFSTTVAGLTFTGAITPQSTGGIVGTTTNDNANTGSVGEFPTPTNLVNVSATSGTPVNVASVSLTAGDWDVSAVAQFNPAGSTTSTLMLCGTSNTSGVRGSFGSEQVLQLAFPAGQGQVISSTTTRFSLAATTTIYAVAQAIFATSTMTISGFIRARRVR